MINKRKRGFLVIHQNLSTSSKDGKCVCSFYSAICLYMKYCKLFPEDLISIHEVRVLESF